MAHAKRKTDDGSDPVVEKLMDGHYDRALMEFEAQLEEAAEVLRQAYAALRAENTLNS